MTFFMSKILNIQFKKTNSHYVLSTNCVNYEKTFFCHAFLYFEILWQFQLLVYRE